MKELFLKLVIYKSYIIKSVLECKITYILEILAVPAQLLCSQSTILRYADKHSNHLGDDAVLLFG